MKKKTILIIIAVLLVVLGVYTGFRFATRGMDIIGVTTLPNKNMVILNAKPDSEFVAGSGYITVAEGEKLHLDYNITSGSFDIAFRADEDADKAYDVSNLDLEDLPTVEEMIGEGSFGDEEITGKGSRDFDVEPGMYTVHIINHDVVGKATVTAKK